MARQRVQSKEHRVTTPATLNILAGLWLVVAPLLLLYGQSEAAGNSAFVGIVVAVFAYGRLIGGAAWMSWANLALGIWLVISPWALGFADATAPLWNTVIFGIVIAALALWAARTGPKGELGIDRERID